MTADLAIFPPPAAARRSPTAEARHLHPAALPQWRALLGFRWRERLERVTEFSLAYHDAEEAAADAGSGRDARRHGGGRARSFTGLSRSGSRSPRSRRRWPGWQPGGSAGASSAAPPSPPRGWPGYHRPGTARRVNANRRAHATGVAMTSDPPGKAPLEGSCQNLAGPVNQGPAAGTYLPHRTRAAPGRVPIHRRLGPANEHPVGRVPGTGFG